MTYLDDLKTACLTEMRPEIKVSHYPNTTFDVQIPTTTDARLPACAIIRFSLILRDICIVHFIWMSGQC